VCFVDGDFGWTAGQGGTILHTTNGGEDWIPQSSGTAEWLYSVHFNDANEGWVVGSGGTILHTIDGGATWSPQSSGTFFNLEGIYFVDANIGWVAGELGTILHTTDGGASWIPQVSGTTNYLAAVYFPTPTNGWVVGETGTIMRTTTGGTGVTPPAAPILSSPANGSNTSLSPTITWDPAVSALGYTAQVSPSQYFVSFVTNESGLSPTSLEVGGLQSQISYYWRVSVTDTTGTSNWSEAWSFTTATPYPVVLNSPPDGAIITADSAVCVWNTGTPSVTGYWFEADDDPSFGSPVLDSTLTGTSFTLDSLQHGDTLYWRVRAKNSFGWGEISAVRMFSVFQQTPTVPVLLDPPNGTVGVSTSPTLDWDESSGAESYSLQVSDTVDFSNLVVDESGVVPTEYMVADLDNNVTYYWRVSATNGLGTSDWSELWNFTTALTGVDEEDPVPVRFELEQNYPNPFNPQTEISFQIADAGFVTLEVFNLLGQSVATIVHGKLNPGRYSAVWDAAGQPSGIYFYKLSSDRFVATRKMVVLK
jgi:hypothetical protein